MDKCLQSSYAVVIRTLGQGGEKYKHLLNSIKESSVQPKHIYVIIAEGYELPKEQLGTEEFIYTKKGMWHQRIYGLQYASRVGDVEYILALDDDISFNPTFVADSIVNMKQIDAGVLIPECLSPTADSPLKIKVFSLRNLILSLMGCRYESRCTNFRIKIAPTAGYIANTALNDACNPTQSGQFAAFWIKNDCIGALELEEEYWLDDTAYALPDDMVFFYKAYIKNFGVYHNRDLVIRHLDHGSSNPDRIVHFAFATGRNFLIFWHRFLYVRQKSLLKKILYMACMGYRIMTGTINFGLLGVKHKSIKPIQSYLSGVMAACRYITSEPYISLRKL